MKQGTFIAILLTFLMLLLVVTAAAIFLIQRNTSLERTATVQSSNQTPLKATAEQAISELAVRNGALKAADATRAALGGQLTASSRQIDRLQAEVTRQQSELAEATVELSQYSIQVFPLSPKNGAIVQPWEPVEIMMAAQAEAGVDHINIEIDGEPFETFPAGGVPIFTIRTSWIPEEEGTFTIQTRAEDVFGDVSDLIELTISSVFEKPEERQAALLKQTEQQLMDLRLSQSTAISVETLLLENFDPHQFIFADPAGDEMKTSEQALLLQALDIPVTARELSSFQDLWNDGDLLAYYSPSEEKVYYYREEDLEGIPEEWLYAHRYAHQLQDDIFRLSALNLGGLNQDELLARQSFIESDALYLQYLFGQNFEADQIGEASLLKALNDAADSRVNALSPFLQNTLSFYFADGMEFILALDDSGGKEAIDQAWISPPLSTEQILHPDRYLEGEQPMKVVLSSPSDLIRGTWQLGGERVVGEFLLREHLGQLSQDAARIEAASTGWAGGQLALFTSGDVELLMMGLTWDSAEDAQEFVTFYGDLLSSTYESEIQEPPVNSRCWQADESICLLVDEQNVLIVKGPDLESVTTIASDNSIMSVQ